MTVDELEAEVRRLRSALEFAGRAHCHDCGMCSAVIRHALAPPPSVAVCPTCEGERLVVVGYGQQTDMLPCPDCVAMNEGDREAIRQRIRDDEPTGGAK